MQVVYMEAWYYDRITNGCPNFYKGYYYWQQHVGNGVWVVKRARKGSPRAKHVGLNGEHWHYVNSEQVELRRTKDR